MLLIRFNMDSQAKIQGTYSQKCFILECNQHSLQSGGLNSSKESSIGYLKIYTQLTLPNSPLLNGIGYSNKGDFG